MNYLDLINKGAKVLDVRTEEEFNEEHFEGSVNIPVNDVLKRMDEIKELGSPLIVVCFMGGRAGVAKAQIEAAGVKEVYNAGGWEDLQDLLSVEK